ncbi:hypothetical protein ABE096_17900 [Robertmurraya massiliosenegalensis]
MGKKRAKDASRVEFGNEFGEVNAAKNYEVPFASREKKDVGSKKKQ